MHSSMSLRIPSPSRSSFRPSQVFRTCKESASYGCPLPCRSVQCAIRTNCPNLGSAGYQLVLLPPPRHEPNVVVEKPLCWALLSLPGPGQADPEGPTQRNGLTERLCAFLVDPTREEPEVRLEYILTNRRLTSTQFYSVKENIITYFAQLSLACPESFTHLGGHPLLLASTLWHTSHLTTPLYEDDERLIQSAHDSARYASLQRTCVRLLSTSQARTIYQSGRLLHLPSHGQGHPVRKPSTQTTASALETVQQSATRIHCRFWTFSLFPRSRLVGGQGSKSAATAKR